MAEALEVFERVCNEIEVKANVAKVRELGSSLAEIGKAIHSRNCPFDEADFRFIVDKFRVCVIKYTRDVDVSLNLVKNMKAMLKLGFISKSWCDRTVVVAVLDIIKTFAKNSEIIQDAAELLAEICYKMDEIQLMVLEAGGVEMLVGTFSKHLGSALTTQIGMFCLGNMCYQSPSIKKSLYAGGGVSLSLKALARHQPSSGTVQWGCYFLRSVFDASLEEQYAETCPCIHTHVHLIEASMKAHSDVEEVFQWGCYTLGKVWTFSELTDEARIPSALETILVCLEKHGQSNDSLLTAVYTLHCVSATPNFPLQTLVAHPAVFQSLLRIFSDEFQGDSDSTLMLEKEMVLSFLSAVSCDVEDVQRAVFESGAIPVVLNALKKHQDAPGLLQRGLYALGNICAGVQDIQQCIFENGGLPIVMQSLQSYPDHPDVVDSVCYLLGNISFGNIQVQRWLFEADAVSILLNLKTEDGSSLKRALFALGNICQEAPMIQSAAVEAGGLKRTLDLLSETEDIGVLEASIQLLVSLFYGSTRVLESVGHVGFAVKPIQQEIIEADGVSLLLGLIQAYKDVPGVVEVGCFALGHLSCHSEEVKNGMVDQGIIESVLEALERFAENEHTAVLEWACYALGSICIGMEDVQRAVFESGAIPVVLNALKKHQDAPGLLQRGLYALGNICAGVDTVQNKIFELDGVLIVLQAIRDFARQFPTVAEWGIQCLANMCAGVEAIQQTIFDNGGLYAALDCMKMHSDHPGVIDSGCYFLGNVSFGGEEIQKSIFELKGHLLLLNALATHKNSAGIVQRACFGLGNVCAGMPEIQEAVVGANGVTLLLNAMRLHRRIPGVSDAGSFCLGFLARNDSKIRLMVQEQGGLELIVSALRAHGRLSPEVAQRLLYSLSVLCHGELRAQETVLELNGVEIVGNLLQLWNNEPQVAAEGFRTMASVCFELEDAQWRMFEDKFADLILQAIRDFARQFPTVAEWGIQCLANMCAGVEAIQQTIFEKDGLLAVMDCMKMHSDHPGVIDSGCYFLGNVSFGGEEIQQSIFELKGHSFLMKVMTSRERSPGIVQRACFGLGNVCAGMPEIQEAVVEAGGVTLLLNVMRLHRASRGVTEIGCFALGHLAPYLSKMRGGVEELADMALYTLAKFSENLKTVLAMFKVLKANCIRGKLRRCQEWRQLCVVIGEICALHSISNPFAPKIKRPATAAAVMRRSRRR